MFSKFSLSLAAALVLVSAAGVARAETNPPCSIDEVNAVESGNPDSVDFAGRAIPMRSTNDDISASESGNPDSVDNRTRAIPAHSPTNDEINAAEVNNPESSDYKDRQPGNVDVMCPA